MKFIYFTVDFPKSFQKLEKLILESFKFFGFHKKFTKVLFICNQNKHRSKTAEELFKDRFETRSAGLFNEKPISEKELGWADILVVMEEEQRLEIAKRFPKYYLQKRIISLDIHDAYYYNQLELVDILNKKISKLFEPFIK